MTRTWLAVAVLAGCGGSDSSPKDAAIDAHKAIDAATVVDGPPIDTVLPDASLIDAPANSFQLTVKNYLAWCTVSIAGMPTSAASVQTVTLTAGNDIQLVGARANATFIIGPKMWHHTKGDTAGTGEDGAQVGGPTGTSTAAVDGVAGVNKCVWVCCPFTNGTGCENTIPDQCP